MKFAMLFVETNWSRSFLALWGKPSDANHFFPSYHFAWKLKSPITFSTSLSFPPSTAINREEYSNRKRTSSCLLRIFLISDRLGNSFQKSDIQLLKTLSIFLNFETHRIQRNKSSLACWQLLWSCKQSELKAFYLGYNHSNADRVNRVFFSLQMLSAMILIGISILSMTSGQTSYVCDRNASCGCSTSPALVSRIFGGETAMNNTWGWAVSVLFNNTFYCGATLISPSAILTTAACIGIYRASEIAVSVATTRFLGWTQWRYASVMIKHPNYDPVTRVNDIALLRVSPPFDMTDQGIAQICVPMMTTEDYPMINTSVSRFFNHGHFLLIVRLFSPWYEVSGAWMGKTGTERICIDDFTTGNSQACLIW